MLLGLNRCGVPAGWSGTPPPTESVDGRACFLCGEEDAAGLERCGHCRQVWTCSRDHLEVHRPGDRCFPFVIKRSKEKGR